MDHLGNSVVHCCADCGSVAGGGISLKACKSCMLVKYCNANCQRNHWPKHTKVCKLRAAELHDEALFKDPPPAKEECPICFVPMPVKLISCMTLPPATITSIPIYDFAMANQELAKEDMEDYYSCCGNYICSGCIHSLCMSGNYAHCPFCKAETMSKTNEERIEEMMKRVEANDAGAIYALGSYYHHGGLGLHQDGEKEIELWKQAARLGSSKAHHNLGNVFYEGGDMKKAKFHYEAAAIAGHEGARSNLGDIEGRSGNVERGFKHWIIAASAGDCNAMYNLQQAFEQGLMPREAIDLTLTAYNSSCKEMRSEARDAFIRTMAEINDHGM